MNKESRYGKKIREMREARAWTQEQLAAAADVETRTVQRVEKDLTKNPETLQAIAGAFNVDLATLRTTWLIPETRLLKTHSVENHKQFIAAQQAYRFHAYSRIVMAPLIDEYVKQVDVLLDQIFSDRELIEPDERELWKAYVEYSEEPLTRLFDLKLAMFIVDERKDVILPQNGFLKPEKPYIDDWRVQHFLVVPRYGCFRTGDAAPVHHFNDGCAAAGQAVFQAVTHEDVGLNIFANALFAYSESTNWCDVCFPALSDGSRINIEYIERVTGLTRTELHELHEATLGGHFLNGLS